MKKRNKLRNPILEKLFFKNIRELKDLWINFESISSKLPHKNYERKYFIYGKKIVVSNSKPQKSKSFNKANYIGKCK